MSVALAHALRNALHLLPVKDQGFANSLISQAETRGGTAKQVHWMQTLLDRAKLAAAPAAPAEPSEVVAVGGIVTLLTGAAGRLKYPKVRLLTDCGQKVVVGMAGPRSRYVGQVMITDGGSFHNGTYFGRIDLSGQVFPSANMTPAVMSLLTAFAADPAGIGAMIGKRIGACCFCSRGLETSESLAVGYGPVCADKYSLPWG